MPGPYIYIYIYIKPHIWFSQTCPTLVAAARGVAPCGAEAGLAHVAVSLQECAAPGTLVVADLTDPLLSAADASCIFQVLLLVSFSSEKSFSTPSCI